MNAGAAARALNWNWWKHTHTHSDSAQLWNDWRTCELSDAFSWLFNSVTGCLAIDSESWLAVGGSAAYVARLVCVFVWEHACIHNGQNIPSCCRGISPPLRNGTSDRALGITAIAVVLMQCHTLLLCSCVSPLFSMGASLHRVLDCRHISPWGRCVNMSVSHCCRQGLCFVLMKWAQLLACSKWIISAETQRR